MKKQAETAAKPAKKCDCKCSCDEKKARPPIFGNAKWLYERFNDKATPVSKVTKSVPSSKK